MVVLVSLSFVRAPAHPGYPGSKSRKTVVVVVIRLEQVDNREMYVYNGKYWETRRDPGFMNVNLPKLW